MTARPAVKPLEGVCRGCGLNLEYRVSIETDLCLRCHGPAQPTRAQTGEIGRIRERLGPLTVRPSMTSGCVEVVLTGTDEDREWRKEHHKPARMLVLDRRGHVIGRHQVRA